MELDEDEVTWGQPPPAVAVGSTSQGAYTAEAHLKLKHMLEEFERGMAAQQAQQPAPQSQLQQQQQQQPSAARALNRSLFPAVVESTAVATSASADALSF
jgi:hypothetical protein